MANLNKKQLDRYITEIFHMNLFVKALNERIDRINNTIEEYDCEYYCEKPDKPQLQSFWGCTTGFFLVLGIFMFIPFFGLLLGEVPGGFFAFLSVVGAIIGGVIIFRLISAAKATSEENEAATANYYEEMTAYREESKKIENENAARRAQIPSLKQQRDRFKKDLAQAETLLKTLYSWNVIPLGYQDLYAAVYLYNIIPHSAETSVTAALNLYVLEQIKAKLDHIIDQNQEMLLMKRASLAIEKRREQENLRHHAVMERIGHKKLELDEKRNDTLEDICTYQAIDTLFSAADYFRKK